MVVSPEGEGRRDTMAWKGETSGEKFKSEPGWEESKVGEWGDRGRMET